MRVVYSPHLKDRIKIRNFNENDPRVIFYRADKKYFDTLQNSNISIKNLIYNGAKQQLMKAFIYDKISNSVIIKTIHVESNQEIINRLKIDRYIKR